MECGGAAGAAAVPGAGVRITASAGEKSANWVTSAVCRSPITGSEESLLSRPSRSHSTCFGDWMYRSIRESQYLRFGGENESSLQLDFADSMGTG